VRFTGLMLALVLVTSACSRTDNPDSGQTLRADSVASTALANSQDGTMEVVQYALGGSPGGTQAPAAQIVLTGCEQVDIVRWRLTGTVEADDGPSSGWLVFSTDTRTPSTPFAVDVIHSGSFSVEVLVRGLTDLALSCQIAYPEGDRRHDTTRTTATPFSGVFTWDAEPGTVASLGSGLVAGDRGDPRRAWAEQFWFGDDLPFDRILAVDRTSVGVPVVAIISWSQPDRSPCREVTLVFRLATVTQSESCPTSDHPIEVGAPWQVFDRIGGLVFEANGRGYLVGSGDGWNVTIVAESVGDIVELASSLQFYDNGALIAPTNVDTRYPISEDALVTELVGGALREVGRVDTTAGRFLLTEGPLNPTDPSDYLRQLRVYRLAKQGRYWNPVLVAGSNWDRCLGTAQLGVDRTFIVTGDSEARVERSDGVDLDLLERAGRTRLAAGSYVADVLRIRIDGELEVCTAPVVTTIPSVVPTTGTVPGTTDDTTPGGSTDTTAP